MARDMSHRQLMRKQLPFHVISKALYAVNSFSTPGSIFKFNGIFRVIRFSSNELIHVKLIARRTCLYKLIVSKLAKKFPAFYCNRRFITVSLEPATAPHNLSRSLSFRFILILPSHVCVGLWSGLFPSGSPIKILYAFLVSHTCYMTRPSHPSVWVWILYSLSALLGWPNQGGYGWSCSTHCAYKILIGKSERNRSLGRSRRGLEDNIRMDVRETGWKGVNWKGPVVGSCEHGNEPSCSIKFLTSWVTISFSRKTLLRGINFLASYNSSNSKMCVSMDTHRLCNKRLVRWSPTK